MTLENRLLEKLADAGAGTAPAVVNARDGAWNIDVHAQKSDEFSVVVDHVEIRRDGASGGDARAWADQIAARPSGLLEPLRVLEADAGKNEAILRSAEPAKKGDEIRYFEVHVQGGEKAEVHRYKASRQPGVRREAVPFPMTHEALGKLASGLAGDS